MAIDTEQKRRTASGYCRASGLWPQPTGASSAEVRAQVLADYRPDGSSPPPAVRVPGPDWIGLRLGGGL